MIILGIGLLTIAGISLFGSPISANSGGNGMILKNWRQFDDLFKAAAQKYALPDFKIPAFVLDGVTYGPYVLKGWQWLKVVCLKESTLGNHKKVARGLIAPTDVAGSTSEDGLSWGLMQVTLKTAREMDPSATEVKLNDPAYSIDLAARYVRTLRGYFDVSDPRFAEWVAKAYNQGPGRTQKERAGTAASAAASYWTLFKGFIVEVMRNP